MESKQIILTYEGLQAREAELNDLKVNKRREVAQKIKEARAQGDLSENAEYDAAREEQGEMESRIAQLEKELRNAVIIDEDETKDDIVTLGSRVKLFDKEFDEELDFAIVGSSEANPIEGRISNESPLGMALLGAHVGEDVNAQTPDGIAVYTVLSIQKA